MLNKLEKRLKARGTSFCKNMKKWKVSIRYEGTNRHLGYFETEEEAREVYVAAAKKLFGGYTKLKPKYNKTLT